MGTCPNCGRWSFWLSLRSCDACGKQTCNDCAIYLFKVLDRRGQLLDVWSACSQKCVETLAVKFRDQLSPQQIPISEEEALKKIPLLMQQIMRSPKNQAWLGKYIREMSEGKPFYINFAPLGDEGSSASPSNLLWKGLSHSVRLVVAQHLITARRFEDAAKLYEKLGMYEEAGNARARGSEIRVRKTAVSLDLNSLLQQIKDGGMVVVYRCPHCGGNLKVGKDTSIESLKVCEHCGSEIEKVGLADFLRTALS